MADERTLASLGAAAFDGHPAPLFTELLQKCVPWGLVVVGRHREIVFCNERARSYIETSCGIEQRLGALHVQVTAANETLGHLVERACAPEAIPSAHDERVAVPGPDGRIRYVIRVMPCRTTGDRLTALLIIADIRPGTAVSREHAARIFHLTGRESELAELFSAGLHVDEISRRMRISTSTARVHLQNVFEKTGCYSQIDLARLIAHLP